MCVSNSPDITTGVMQGNELAPVLFNLILDTVIAVTMSSHPRGGRKMLYNLENPLVGGRRKMRERVNVSDLEYADDATLVSDSMDALEEVLKMLNRVCVGMELTINARKIKVLAVCPFCIPSMPTRSVQLGEKEENVDVVEEFEYLGSTISLDCSLDHEINRRISKASCTFRSLYRVVWHRKRLKVERPSCVCLRLLSKPLCFMGGRRGSLLHLV